MPLLALLPEILDAILVFVGANWWQIAVGIGIFKLEQIATEPTPAPGQAESPAQVAVAGAGAAVGGVGHGVGNAGQGVGSGIGAAGQGFGDLLKNNMPIVAIGLAAIFLLGGKR